MKTMPRDLPADRIVTVPSDRRTAVLETIHGAKQRITLSLFRCSDKEIFAALADAVDRGVDVQVIVTSRAKGGKQKLRKLWRRLEDTAASLYAYTDPVVKYHAKYLVADDGPRGRAGGRTRSSLRTHLDALALTWDRRSFADCIGCCRSIASAARPRRLPTRLIVGPERARRQFTALIEGARRSIRIVDAKLSDPGLIALLNARRAQGLDVQVHGDKLLGGLRSHGKLMLIDGSRAVVGSLALTALSLDFRREVALVVDEPGAVAEIETVFRAIEATAGAPGSTSPVIVGGA
jgi:phosphatidylserine/phosphatidylglycerophosphate/cardiolipin synthase-like enzyme